MRISLRPVLACGWVLAALVGQTAVAFEPADGYADFASAAYEAEDADDSELFDDPSFESSGYPGMGVQPVQHVMGGAPGMAMPQGGNPYFAQGGYPPTAWPEVSPYNQPNMNMHSLYNRAGVWQYEDNFETRKYLFGMEMLISRGLKPGNHELSDDRFLDVDFLPGIPQAFPHRNTVEYTDLKHYGYKAHYGWENPDESGFVLSGWQIFENEVQKGPGRTYFNDGNFANLSTRLGGITFNNNGVGEAVPYDSEFAFFYDQDAWGADADFIVSPFFERKNFQMQLTWGVKYMHVHEQFRLRAGDSGLGYVFILPSGNIDLSTVTDIGIPPYVFNIASNVTSNLVGPQVGMKYELGGDKFKIWGQTKVAVAANMEKMRVNGENAVNGFTSFALQGPKFDHTKTTTHISPIFDQSIYGEFPLFAALPIFNKISFINKANFRVGYNYVLIGEVARPAQIINWLAVDPNIRTNRSPFSLKTVSFAVDWKW
jgi:hypothetical protein